MLMDQLERYSAKKYFKLINVEKLLSKGMKLPADVHVVPALMILPSKKVLVGKPLFDYLLLPNKGFIFTIEQSKATTDIKTPISDDPIAFGFNQSAGDGFSFIEDGMHNTNDEHKQYSWASLHENVAIETPKEDDYVKEEKQSARKQKMPDISILQSERASDLQNYLNNTALPPASSDR